jgi:hypothetical protein
MHLGLQKRGKERSIVSVDDAEGARFVQFILKGLLIDDVELRSPSSLPTYVITALSILATIHSEGLFQNRSEYPE